MTTHEIAKKIAALLTLVLCIFSIWWLYDQEYHYPNTEKGRQDAVNDYIPAPEDASFQHVKAGTPINVGAWQEIDNQLFIFFIAENEENVHGILHLSKGINGKYRTLNSSLEPSKYSGGIYSEYFSYGNENINLYYIATYNCKDIQSADLKFYIGDYEGLSSVKETKHVELSGENTLTFVKPKEIIKRLGYENQDYTNVDIIDVILYDKDGNDVTGKYKDEGMDTSWGAGKGTAETFLLYVYIGIVLLLGVILIRFFLSKK